MKSYDTRLGEAIVRQRGVCDICGARMRYVLCQSCAGAGVILVDETGAPVMRRCASCHGEGGWYEHDCPLPES